MQNILLVFQIVISFLLILTISLQTKGGGLSRTISAGAPSTRRGLEKLIFKTTFVLVFLFILVSILQIIL